MSHHLENNEAQNVEAKAEQSADQLTQEAVDDTFSKGANNEGSFQRNAGNALGEQAKNALPDLSLIDDKAASMKGAMGSKEVQKALDEMKKDPNGKGGGGYGSLEKDQLQKGLPSGGGGYKKDMNDLQKGSGGGGHKGGDFEKGVGKAGKTGEEYGRKGSESPRESMKEIEPKAAEQADRAKGPAQGSSSNKDVVIEKKRTK